MANGRWRAATNGPDWLDVKMYLLALDSLHGCNTTVVLRPDGSAGSAVWLVCLHSAWPDLDGKANFAQLSSSLEWPNVQAASLVGAVYYLCYQHDHAVGQRMYCQQELPYDA